MIFHKILALCTGFGVKLSEIFQSVYGWLAAVCFFVANFFAGYEVAINAVVVCVALDGVLPRRSSKAGSHCRNWAATACCRSGRCTLRSSSGSF